MNENNNASDAQKAANSQQSEVLDLVEQSQRVVQAFWERQAKEAAEGGFSVIDSQGVAQAFADFGQSFWLNPGDLAKKQMEFWQDNINLVIGL